MMRTIAFVLFYLHQTTGLSTPKVCKNTACITGTTMPGYETDAFEAFLGIPYAEPPIGKNRFSNPVELKNYWVANQTRFKPNVECLQKNYLIKDPQPQGEEDCLYLNVYRPILPERTSEPLPVMFYIYGGGLFSGSNLPVLHGPEYFMDSKKVILVIPNYRLGVFGFLSSGSKAAPGNLGLKDQLMALRWVNKNIGYFGGNPNSVTIFGQSAGAWSVHLHLMSAQSKNLFHRAVLLSGSALAPYAYPVENPLEQAQKLAEFCGVENVPQLSTYKLIESLRGLDAVNVLNASDKLKYWHIDPLTVFRPTIEDRNDPNAFLTEDPMTIAQRGDFNYVPLMMSFVPHEGAVRTLQLITDPNQISELNERYNELMPKLLEIDLYNNTQKNLEAITKLYFGESKHVITVSDEPRLTNLYSDRAFHAPLYNTLRTYVENAHRKDSVGIIEFNHRGPYSYSALFSGLPDDFGVVHCDDLLYLFRTSAVFPEFVKDSIDAKIVRRMIEIYTNFAETGKVRQYGRVERCTKEVLQTKMCDYQEITSSGKDCNGYQDVKVSTKHIANFNQIRFWTNIDSRQNFGFNIPY